MIFFLLRKIHLERYFNARLILFIDLMVSVAASLFVLFIYRYIFEANIPHKEFIASWSIAALAASALMFIILRTYKSIIRYQTLKELKHLLFAVLGKTALMAIVLTFFRDELSYGSLLFDFLLTFGALVILRITMIMIYDLIHTQLADKARSSQRILIYGNDEKAVSQEVRLRNSGHYKVAGFIVYGNTSVTHTIAGLKVYHFLKEEDLYTLSNRYDIDGVLFPYYADAQNEQKRLLKYCSKCGLQTLISPSIDTINDGQIPRPLRKIKIEDLLGRQEIKVPMQDMVSNFKGKTILVTGAAGSIGSELCRQLVSLGVGELVMYDNAETPLHNLRLEFHDHYRGIKFSPIIGDVRIPARLDYVFRKYRPQIVFHAAAYKHVPLMEENPCEAVMVNVAGSRNVADKCIEYDVEKMVMISTDKAVNPTNIMGCTKRLAEIYVQSLGLAVEGGRVSGKTKFVTTRFGNVLGSNGSVIPRFKEQIANGGPVTVTHPDITRFFMTIPEACRLVMEAATISSGNQICVFDMGESVKIAHLAEQMIELSGFEVGKDIKIEYTGLRPGEKLYEEVLASEENTLPTSHHRIRIARVREYEYGEAGKTLDRLQSLAANVNIPDMIKLMMETVPEFMHEYAPDQQQ